MLPIRIFTVGHNIDFPAVQNSIFSPFVTGVDRVPGGVLGDNNGDNIARQLSYCELRAQYYVWKNICEEQHFVGFQQYRRLFIVDKFYDYSKSTALSSALCNAGKYHGGEPIRVEPDLFYDYLDWINGWTWNETKAIEEWLIGWDIITPRPILLTNGLAAQYVSCHIKSHWDCFIAHVDRHDRFSRLRSRYDYDLSYLMPFNMYILKKEIFVDYMEYWRDIMSAVEKDINVGVDPYQSRALGFLSERLFTIYLYLLRLERPGLAVLDLPCLVHA